MVAADDIESARQKIEASAEYSLPEDTEDLQPEVAAKSGITFIDDEGAETSYPGGPPLRRRTSSYSVHSLSSVRSGQRVLDPHVALPVQYRTLSYNIENVQEPQPTKDLKEKAANDIEELEWHTLSPEKICERFQTSTQSGLTAFGVKQKRAEFGRNAPSPPPSQLLRKLFSYFFSGFGSILLTGAILVYISWQPLGDPPATANLVLANVLVAVFFIQAGFNAWQDFSSSRVMKSITGMLPESCHVLRDGRKQTIQGAEVVPGDVLYFKAGDKLPADVRFVNVSSDAKFDRSILTGESIPLAAVTESTDYNYLETKCIGMQGTHCTSGSGVGIVVATGDMTIFGQIAKFTSTPNRAFTPLQKEIIRFVAIVVTLMITLNIVVVGVWAGYIRTNHPDYMPVATLVVNIVSVAIAFVPEGLPIALTASLTITAGIMKKNDILCKSLKTVETLGSVSVLLSDKTGTLTKNQMAVTDCLVGLSAITAENAANIISTESDDLPKKSALEQLRIAAAVNNDGEFDPTTIHLPLADRRIIADATDQAILRLSESFGPVSESRGMWRKRFDLAFNSKNKYALRVLSAVGDTAATITLSKSELDAFDAKQDMLLLVKGAPDILLPRCTKHVGEDGESHELDARVRTSIEGIKDSWSSQGKRVILLARKTLPLSNLKLDPNDGGFEVEITQIARTDLTLVSLVGIVDPPRDEVPGVIDTLRRAGIRTMMVTGDFELTAQAIARDCGIITVPDSKVHTVGDLLRAPLSNNITVQDKKNAPLVSPVSSPAKAIVLTGDDLWSLSRPQWHALATTYTEIVFSRTTPGQKLRIVKEFQSYRYVVAMTGDGVNDAPSLKQADIGIAPVSGSNIAIEAADMVLLDTFSAVPAAVLYGRVVFDNLKKTIAYLLPAGSFAELWPVMTSVVFGLPQALSSFLMVIICCFTDCAAAIVLAYELPEADVMLRPPRDVRSDRLVDWKLLLQSYGLVGLIETTCSFAMAFWYLELQNLHFSDLWFSFGHITTPFGEDGHYVAHHLAVASSIYFVTLVVMQWFSLMALRTRRLSIFSHPPLFNKLTANWLLFPAILFALMVALIFTLVPGMENLGCANVPVNHWFLPFVFGLVLLSIDEVRKAVNRRWKHGVLAKMAW